MKKSEQIMTKADKIDKKIRQYLSTGNKIHAVKYYREETHCGLEEAYKYVSLIEKEMKNG